MSWSKLETRSQRKDRARLFKDKSCHQAQLPNVLNTSQEPQQVGAKLSSCQGPCISRCLATLGRSNTVCFPQSQVSSLQTTNLKHWKRRSHLYEVRAEFCCYAIVKRRLLLLRHRQYRTTTIVAALPLYYDAEMTWKGMPIKYKYNTNL